MSNSPLSPVVAPQSENPPATPPTAADLAKYQQALTTLYNLLNQAYWYATTIETKDVISGLIQAIAQVLSQLDQTILNTNTDQYKQLSQQVSAVNAKLRSLQSEINDVVHAISIATQVASAIDQALAYCAQLFK